MKKTPLWLAAACIAFCAFMNISCASTPLADPQNFQNQTYKVAKVNFLSDIQIYTKEDALSFFENLPVESLQAQLLEKYNIELEADLLDKAKLADNLQALVSTSKSGEETILGWYLSAPDFDEDKANEIIKKYKKNEKITEEDLASVNEIYNHIASINVRVTTQQTNYSKGLSMSVMLYNSSDEVMPHAYVDEFWTPVSVIADKATAAKVSFSSAIKPAYLIIDGQIVIYAAYAKDNSADKEGVYIDSGKQVTIVSTVNDPGVIMLFEPCTFYSQKLEKTFEAGKSYSVKHKVTNRSASMSNWKVEFSVEEK